MCIVALMFRVVDDAGIVIGVNREERYDRGGEPLNLREGPRPFVAGQDPVAGGTWWGVNNAGVIIAITNRRKSEPPSDPPSRGLLVRDLLAIGTAREAIAEAQRRLTSAPYAGCNLLCIDREQAIVIHAGDWMRVQPLPAGIHILANGDVNDAGDPRVVFAGEQLRRRSFHNAEEALTAVRLLCSSTEPPSPICWHASERGTVSSTLLACGPTWDTSRLMHAQGPPDRTGYQDRTDLLLRLRDK